MKYQKLLDYIDAYWAKLEVEVHEDSEMAMALPNKFIAPSAEIVDNFVFHEQFYWDTYFTSLGLEGTDRQDTIKGMTDNLLFMLGKIGYIPNSSNPKWHSGRSQPPVLSMLILKVYDLNQDKDWLEDAYFKLIDEYKTVWLGKRHPHHRKVYHGLSRYYNANQQHIGAEDESGWDYTPRFYDRALDFLPIDLNCLLYKYESDLGQIADILGREIEAHQWRSVADLRAIKINKYMWNEQEGMFFDYDFTSEQQGEVKSLAAYFAMFVGLATEDQAKKLVDNLDLFKTQFGLSTTVKYDEPIVAKQWAAPNGWAPLHYIVVTALQNYGYDDEAKEIAQSWVKTVHSKFEKTGNLYEKYNVVNLDQEPTSAVYPDQRGFAWTNAITWRFIQDFSLNTLSTPEKAVYTHK